MPTATRYQVTRSQFTGTDGKTYLLEDWTTPTRWARFAALIRRIKSR